MCDPARELAMAATVDENCEIGGSVCGHGMVISDNGLIMDLT